MNKEINQNNRFINLIIKNKIMERNISESPQKWVIIKIGGDSPHYRVFGEWLGGYLGDDRWKVNSGISKVYEDETFYYFEGFSGSCYRCRKDSYGFKDESLSFGSYAGGILGNLIENSEGKINIESESLDFINLIK